MAKKFKTMDGNTAAGYVSYAFTEVAAIYPITPSSPMAETVDDMAAHGSTNIFGQKVKVVEMQSEAGAAGAVHGSLVAGALTTTYTASQGLLLMIPNMYKIAGELLPGVFHVSARTIAAHALCIFGDHSDVMACRQTGFAMLCSSSVQEVMDLAGVAHLAAIEGSVPFLHFFDGFRTSHEIQKIELVDYSVYKKLINMKKVEEFKANAFNPDHPMVRGTAQNGDIFFQAREAAQKYYDALPKIVQSYMDKLGKEIGRKYHLFDYVGAKDAKYVIVAMGSVCECIEEYLNAMVKKGEKIGLVKVRLYRPWAPEYLKKVLPETVKKIAALDRTKEPGAIGDPLYLDLKAMYYGEKGAPKIYAVRYGLGSKDTTPGMIAAVYANLKAKETRDHVTLGIHDDVYKNSIEELPGVVTEPAGTTCCKFWGLGSDGTVGANKQAIKIIGDNTDLYAQGYFNYDSKKSGGVTMSHLRFGKKKIQSTYLITAPDYVAVHNQAYVHMYDTIAGLKKGGTFLLNTVWSDEELNEHLPASLKQYIANNDIKFYTINGTKLGQEIGLGNRINMIMQMAFFHLAKVIPEADAIKYLKASIEKTYGKKGEKVVNMNKAAVDAGVNGLHLVKVPEAWKTAKDKKAVAAKVPAFIKDVVVPVNRQEGDKIPVSTFTKGYEDGHFPVGTSAYEKRGVSAFVPAWDASKCIQCNQCAFVCPHSCIRPVLVNAEEAKKAPANFQTVKATGKGFEALQYRMQVSVLDCLGCGNCVDVCPAKEKALVMKPLGTQDAEVKNWEFGESVSPKTGLMDKFSVKGSQFVKPYFEFSGACAGCGETPYIKVVTQLFGDRMMIANATGCSSIWGGSAPSMPYTTDAKGHGPSWGNSLFEDNAEYGLGMAHGVKQIREQVKANAVALLNLTKDAKVKAAVKAWVDGFNDGETTRATSEAMYEALKSAKLDGEAKKLAKDIMDQKDFFVKRSIWCLGGDGWSYDIGFGGLDHALASGEDINVLVFDTEVYSNTGGQSSKATPVGAIAKFAASGKRIKKKDLGMIAATYGYVYVAQCAMGADKNQFLKAVKEAESYNGPSLIICYAPCINHGIKQGMSETQTNEKKAVACGYWHLFRFNPLLKEAGQNPFTLDSKEPTASFREFIMDQVRYSSLAKEFPEEAEGLFVQAEANAKDRLEGYKKLAAQGCVETK